jgi:hypothetical protein
MAVALLIAVAVLVGWAYRGQLRHAIKDTTNSHPAAQIAPLSPLLGTPPATNLVRLKPRAGLNIPVKVVTEWSTTDPRFGRISVYVPVGETPRKALTVALAQRGFQVVG